MALGVLKMRKYKMIEIKSIENMVKKDVGTYSFHGKGIAYEKFIASRINSLDLKKAVRKDAVVLVEVLVSADTEFFDTLNKSHDTGELETFFNKCYEVLAGRYGGEYNENIISAVVQTVDVNPHLHFCFVPVTFDGRLSAKSIFTRKKLFSLHNDFDKDVWKPWGLVKSKTSELEKKNDQIRNENSQLILKKIRLDTELKKQNIRKDKVIDSNQKGIDVIRKKRIQFDNLNFEIKKGKAELQNIEDSLSEAHIKEKKFKNELELLELKKERLKQEITSLKLEKGLTESLVKR